MLWVRGEQLGLPEQRGSVERSRAHRNRADARHAALIEEDEIVGYATSARSGTGESSCASEGARFQAFVSLTLSLPVATTSPR
jgi:hypothetical protein